MKILITYSFILVLLFSCIKTDDINPSSYLDQCLGEYEGISHVWSSQYLSSIDPILRTDIYSKVYIEVQKGDMDSLLSLTFIYNDSISKYMNEIFFDSTYRHVESSGGGSSYSYLSIHFIEDSLYFRKFQYAGISSKTGEDFVIGKKQNSLNN